MPDFKGGYAVAVLALSALAGFVFGSQFGPTMAVSFGLFGAAAGSVLIGVLNE